ncbi:MAG: hypothetical protein QNK37_28905 [Acidobacteriota bacterium]|nr:hypothetical protein [Acidobacteriota bacterium]
MKFAKNYSLILLLTLAALAASTFQLIAGSCSASPANCSAYCFVNAHHVLCTAGPNFYQCEGYDASGNLVSFNYGQCPRPIWIDDKPLAVD